MKNLLDTETDPKFNHDCEVCEFQGRFNEMDLYKCTQEVFQHPTFVLRFGDNGEQYISMSQDIANTLDCSPMAAINVLYRHNVI